jgi:hypothetical protein
MGASCKQAHLSVQHKGRYRCSFRLLGISDGVRQEKINPSLFFFGGQVEHSEFLFSLFFLLLFYKGACACERLRFRESESRCTMKFGPGDGPGRGHFGQRLPNPGFRVTVRRETHRGLARLGRLSPSPIRRRLAGELES